MDYTLNLGIPCYEEVPLKLCEMTLACTDNKIQSINDEREMRKRTSYIINKETSNTLFPNKEYLPVINYVTDDNSLSNIDLSKRQRFENMFYYFIEGEKYSDKDSIIKCSLDKLNELDTLLNKRDNSVYKKFNNLTYHKPKSVGYYDHLCNIRDYSKTMIDNKDAIEKIDFTRIIEPYLKGLNPDKVALYIAYKSLKKAKKCINEKDFFNAQRHLFYVRSYIDGDFNKKVILDFYTFSNAYYKRADLVKEYFDLLSKYPNELKDIPYYDRDLFVGIDRKSNEIAIDRILNINKIKTDELFIKPGKDDTKKGNGHHDNGPVSPEERNAARRFQQERELFYYSRNPVAVIDCVNKFANYKGFLFENGMIIADRVLKMNSLSETKKDAAYVFTAPEFPDGIKLDKPTLQMLSFPRIWHIPGWESTVDHWSSIETSEEVKEKGKVLSLKKKI
jgi:hypothetical protein